MGIVSRRKVLNRMVKLGWVSENEVKQGLVTDDQILMYTKNIRFAVGGGRTISSQIKAREKEIKLLKGKATEINPEFAEKAIGKHEKEVKKLKALMVDKNEKPKESVDQVKMTFTKAKTQKEEVKCHLIDKGFLTSWTAFSEYGITRLAEYIRQLRSEGMDIETQHVTRTNRYGNQKTFAKYVLTESDEV